MSGLSCSGARIDASIGISTLEGAMEEKGIRLMAGVLETNVPYALPLVWLADPD